MERAWTAHDSMLCVGLDPDPTRMPAAFSGEADSIAPFLSAIVAATADVACAFKPQIAHFAAVAAESALEEVIAMIRREAPHALVILDAKRGDIGSTAQMYAREAFERYRADAVTVNPYLGTDGLAPFLAYEDRGTVVLCRTSNPSGAEFQNTPSQAPLYERVATMASKQWNARGNVMLVAGATQPEELKRIRAIAPAVPLLAPGIGAQGGDIDAVVAAGLDADGWGLVVSSSRAILYASAGGDYAGAARAEAIRTRDALRSARDRIH